MYRHCPACGEQVMLDFALDMRGRPWHRDCFDAWVSGHQEPREAAPDREPEAQIERRGTHDGLLDR